MMNLYLISQTENNGYDSYDSAVVVAESEEAARKIHPAQSLVEGAEWWLDRWSKHTWCESPAQVKVEYLGPYYGWPRSHP